ncbi:MAG: tetratricopeptide repeat protein [Candidatus Omnitrophica bacterium]|nr:tetratricopeptide repeat protein [Candidatus Omnitrophota bacterium]
MLKSQITNHKSQTNYNIKVPELRLKPLTLIIVILVFGIVCNLCKVYCNFNNAYADESAKEEETLFMAQKAYEDGFYDVSLGLLKGFLKNYPDSSGVVEANLLIGECLFQQNKLKPALEKFEELLGNSQAAPAKDALFYWIAEVNFKGDNYPEARLYYNKIIKEFPSSSYAAIAYYSMGWCLFQEHRFKEALQFFTDLTKKYPKEPQSKDAVFKIIECLYNLKDYPALKEKINSAIKESSKDALRRSYLYFYLGEANYYLGDFTASIEAYSKVLAGNPDDKMQALAKLDLGWAYLKLKRYKEAEDIFSGLKQENLEKPNRQVWLLGRAIVLMETNRLNQAKKIYEELLALSGDPQVIIQALMGKADALFSLADYPQASETYRQALAKINLKDSSISQLADKLNYSLGKSLLNEGKAKEAIEKFQKVVDSGSDESFKINSLCQIGDAYLEEANYKKAEEAYNLFLKEYPDSSYSDYILYQLSSSYLKDNKAQEAILSLRALEEKFPASNFLDDAAYALGLAYFNKQDYNSAKLALTKFQTGFYGSDIRPKSLYILGSCFYHLGDYASAIQVFKEIARIGTADAELIQKAEYGQADSLYQLGKEEEALVRFKALRSKYPDSDFTADIIWWLGTYYYQHKEPDLASRYFLSLIQDFPKSDLLADAYYALGLTFIEGAKNKEASEYLKKAIGLNKADIKYKAAVALAELFSKTGDYNNAVDYYRFSLNYAAPEDLPSLHFKIAEIEETKGNLDESEKEYLDAIKLSSQGSAFNITALFRLGRVYEDKGDPAEAVKVYTRISDMNLPESKYAEERLSQLKPGDK